MGNLFGNYLIGSEGNLGVNAPNYDFPLETIIGIEILATSLLMIVILIIVYRRGLGGLSGIVIGGIVGLNIFIFESISGA